MSGWWRCPSWCNYSHEHDAKLLYAHHTGTSVFAEESRLNSDQVTEVCVRPIWHEVSRKEPALSGRRQERTRLMIFALNDAVDQGAVTIDVRDAAAFANLLDSLERPYVAAVVREVAALVEADGVSPS